MARFTNPMDKVRRDARLFAGVQAKAKRMHDGMVTEIAVIVTAEVSGPLKAKDRRRMGYPYARRRLSKSGFERTKLKGVKPNHRLSVRLSTGVGIAVPVLPINADKGDLRRSLRKRRQPPPHPAGQVLELGFTAPHAKYVLKKGGTKRMVDRGFQAWKAKVDKQANRKLQHEINRMILNAAVTGRI